MSLALQLARRFRRSKKQSGFTSFIALSSTFGIGLGCAVLILMLSVMNGFERELKNSLLAYIPHGELTAVAPGGLYDWPTIINTLSQEPGVKQIQPVAKATALLQKGKLTKAVELTGISPEYVQNSRLREKIQKQHWQQFLLNKKGLLLGKTIMEKLQLQVGQQVQVLLPRAGVDKLSAPQSIWLTVTGMVKLGGELDNFIGFMHLSTAAEQLNLLHGAQAVQITFDDPYQAAINTRQMGFRLNQHVYINDWTRTHGHLYQDIKLVRVVVYIALTLLIAVACFNIVSSLVMAVNERKAEIAMLKTMGATPLLIVGVFIWQGLINGLIGILFGGLTGVLLSLYLSELVTSIEALLNMQLLSGDIYFIDFLPSQLQYYDVVLTILIALTLSIAATIYPAVKAAQIKPAQVLGH